MVSLKLCMLTNSNEMQYICHVAPFFDLCALSHLSGRNLVKLLVMLH